MILLAKIAFGLAGAYAFLLAALYFGQRSLMYHPDRERVSPAAADLLNVTERILTTDDGNKLIAWHAKARPGHPTIVYFHGNAGNLSYRAKRIAKFQEQGWGIFMLSYRSYGGSTGHPSEAANISDARLSLRQLVNDGVNLSDIVLYGESLGTAIAIQLASDTQCAGLILDAPFTSMGDAAAYHYPWVWVRPFITDRYQSDEFITRVTMPILILHGVKDRIIPIAMSRELARIAGKKAKLVTFPRGDHINLYEHGAFGDITAFITGLRSTHKSSTKDR